MRRAGMPALSDAGQAALAAYADALRRQHDLRPATHRNYLSDLRQFAAWCEHTWRETDAAAAFVPAHLTTPTVTAYRAHLQALGLSPATINRHLVSLKRYCAWAHEQHLVAVDPGKPVKLVPRVPQPPRQFSDREEAALVAAVTAQGTARDRALLVTALHTGLRAEELCGLRRADVTVTSRSGVVRVYGKRNRYREVPLNSTARDMLRTYLATLPKDPPCLLPSRKGGETVGDAGGEDTPKTVVPITPRALGYLVARYARLAKVPDLSPHDLRHRFGYRTAKAVPLHRLAQFMGHESLDTTRIDVASTRADLQEAVETIDWQ
ncbi:MAG: tyrosine-type recombinase/integrase [Chloroflexota bacterium]